MQETRIAKRYASALFSLAQRHGVVEEVDDELHHLEAVFRSRRLVRFLMHPEIPAQRKERALLRALEGRVRPLVASLLKLLLRKRRIDQFGAVAEYYDLLTDRLRGVEEITITSALPLEDTDYREILGKVVRYSSYPKLRLVKKVNPDLLGGVLIELGRDKVIDLSLRTALSRLRRRLVKYRYY